MRARRYLLGCGARTVSLLAGRCGSGNGRTDAQVFVCVELAEALQHAEDLAAFGEVGWARHDAHMHRARGQVCCHVTGGHGGGSCA